MKTWKHLNPEEIVKLYKSYHQGLDIGMAGHRVDITITAARRWINDINQCLAGEPITRVKGRKNLKLAMKEIKSYLTSPVNEQVVGQLPTTVVERADQKIERLFSELKEALGEYAVELATTKNKEIVEAAQRSNLVGFIKSRWSA